VTRRNSQAARASIAIGLVLSTMALTKGPEALAANAAPTAAAMTAAPFLEPYYTEGDLTGDSQITDADLDRLMAAIGTSDGDAGWAAVSAADLNGDDTIDVLDVATLAQKVIYDDGSFALVESSAVQMQKAMNAGVVTSVQLTQQYLDRIATYSATVVDTSQTGRALNAIISTGGEALAAAAESDALRQSSGGPRSMLDGIPILLKDNYDTKDMPTSAGCACWEDNQTSDDAFMVNGMRSDGAVILGKASMDEFAFGFSSIYSTGSPYDATKSTNGFRYVASPYNTANTAGGSSGGTGAAISSNLGAIGFGTDTGGSIRNPSSYNQLVGVRPTLGLASRDGIVPLALSQDTGGPIGRSVEDVTIALDAVVGTDPHDAATAAADSHVPDSYTEYLDPDALAGKSFAYFTSMVPPATATNAAQVAGRRIFLAAVAELQAQGATVVAIDPSTVPADPNTGVTISKILSEGSGSTNEMKHDLNQYVAKHLDPDVSIRSLSDIVASGKYVPSYKSTYTSRDGITQATYDAWIGTPENPGTHAALIKNGKAYLTSLMSSQGLDAVIYPTALPYSTYSSNLRLSPNTGMPAVTVPAGQTTSAETIPGANVNLEFLGRDYDEGELLGLAYSYEQASHHRTSPSLYGAIDGDTVPGPGDDNDEPGDGSITISGGTEPVPSGDTFTVTVEQSAADLYAYDLSLDYDPTKVAFVSATSPVTGSTSSSAGGGTLDITHTKLGTSPGAQGRTTLATVTFKALSGGASTIAVDDVESVDSTGKTSSPVAPGAVTVTILPPPASTEPAPTTEPAPVAGTVPAGKAPTTVEASLKHAVVQKGEKVTLAVAVTAVGGAPTGTILVRVGGTEVDITRALADGKASVTFRATRRAKGPQVKKRTITVTYLPTGSFEGSSDVVVLKVRRL
jgi:amidase